MKNYKLSAEPRVELGKKSVKALRKENLVPAVINGGKLVELPFKGALKAGEKLVALDDKRALVTTDIVVKNEDLRKLIYSPDIFEIDLALNGETKKVVLKDIQFQPVKDTILHIDFLEVYPDKPIIMEVPVAIEGHAEGVKAGGKLTLSMKKIKVKAPYTAIPERLVINVDTLGLGKTLQIGDLHFPGLEIVTPKEAVVCAVQLTRAARGAAAADAAK